MASETVAEADPGRANWTQLEPNACYNSQAAFWGHAIGEPRSCR